MGAIKKTRLQAFQEAQQTGQIAITEPTAKILKELVVMEEALSEIVGVIQSEYDHDNEYCNSIFDEYMKLWTPLRDGIMNAWRDRIVNNCIAFLEFEGL